MGLRNLFAGKADRHPCADTPETESRGRRDYLLLAPLDSDADAALTKALRAGEWEFARIGRALLLNADGRSAGRLNAFFDSHLSPSLQTRVKGVFLGSEPDTPEALMAAFLQAEALPVLFEQVEMEWARDILQDDRLFSVFHPIVEAATGRVFAYEALIRARHPETGETIGAGQLIYTCEKLNLLHQLDQRARRSAIRDAAALQLPDARFFINFLPSAIYDPEICLRTTLATADEAGLDIERLIFEVVETEQIPDMERLRDILDYYRLLGAGIALDDIGSGYSSLRYLSELLPNYVKIDRNLVAAATIQSATRHTLDSIVRLAKRLGVKVIAEGVETRDHLRVCVEAGADYLQGFFFGRPANPPQPVPADLVKIQQEAA